MLNISYVNSQPFSRQINYLENEIAKSNVRLSTGKQINSVSDNPFMMRRISHLESQIRGIQYAQKNIQDGLSFLDTKETGLSYIQEIGQSLKDLSIRYQNDVLTSSERNQIKEEAIELFKEVNNTLRETKFNGKNVFNHDELTIQTGPSSSNTYTIKASKYIANEHLNNTSTKNSNNYSTSTSETSGEVGNSTESNNTSNPIGVNNKNAKTSGDTKGNKSNGLNITLLGLNLGAGVIGLLDGLLATNIGGTKNNQNQGDSNGSNNTNPSTDSKDITTPSNDTPNNPPTTPSDGLDNDLINEILKPELIDELFLNPISAELSQVGIEKNMLEKRLSFIQKQNDIHSQTLSKIQDIDEAKEMMNRVRNEMLLLTNLYLVQNANDQFRNKVLYLLR